MTVRKQIIRSFLFCLLLLLCISGVISDMMAYTVNLDAAVANLAQIARMEISPENGITIERLPDATDSTEVRSAVEYGQTYALDDRTGTLTVYVHDPANGTVLSVSRRYDNEPFLNGVVIPYNLVGIVVIMGLGWFLVRYISSKALRPVHRLDAAIARARKDGKPLKLEKAGNELDPVVDQLMEMEQAIREEEDLRKRDSRMQQEFFSNASHELKTPLTSIQGYAELLSTGLMSPDQEKICLESITRESLRMKSLIQDILTVSQLESGSQKNLCTVLSIKDMASDIVRSLEPQASAMDVRVMLNCEDLDVYIFKKDLHSILENLIENAIKYNKQGGSVTVKISRQQESVRIFVSDTGIGMDEESTAKMFDRFFRADKQHGPEIPGTGLGMSIVKTAVEHYKGTVKVQSELGEGTRIEVLLPILVEDVHV